MTSGIGEQARNLLEAVAHRLQLEANGVFHVGPFHRRRCRTGSGCFDYLDLAGFASFAQRTLGLCSNFFISDAVAYSIAPPGYPRPY